MARFHITKTKDPTPYTSELERFWQENLPDTAPARLKWMMEGNPAGPATWFLAFDETKGTLAGTISVMPKNLFINGRPTRCGIIGDLMVDKRYRVFGPAVLLPKAVMSNASALGMEYLYTIPNRASAKILERCSFKRQVSYESFVRPVHLTSYLGKYLKLSSGFTRILSMIENRFTVFSNRLRKDAKGFFIDDHIDESFQQLCDEFARRNSSLILGERGSNYLMWRYKNNPQHNFKVLTHRFSAQGEVAGYLVYGINGNMLEIYDLVSLSNLITGKMIKRMIRFAQEGGFKGIYATINPRMPLALLLSRNFFFNNGDRLDLYCPKDMNIPAEKWYFLAGDRNI